ncbi:MAG TPA: PEP-CTERM sorting domain-containing protein [Verrucomicrobiae bacterium]|nr:PEP-CTERM sorting domain-containing protein [Verrucomicrobiae bacterium]
MSVIAVAAAVATACVVSQGFADWIQFPLPNLSEGYSPTALAHLPDGRYLFANQGTYYRQDAFGSAGYTAYSNVSPGDSADPSFVAVWDATHAVAGGGGFGASDLYRFDPSSLGAPTFVAQGLSLQNYSGVFRDATSLYVGGANGTGSTHSISYIDLISATTKVIIDNISTYSCDFAQDASGNLYVGDNDDGKVYKFTAAQLSLAISGSALAISDGTFVHQFDDGLGTMAVDGEGRIWSAGWMANGLQAYDPVSNTEFAVIPGLTNANYKVTTFTAGGQDYVAFMDQANPGQAGTAQYYGYEAIPEPGTFALALAGLVVLPLCRRNRDRRS